MDLQSGRAEKRQPMSVPVWLTSSNRPGPFARAITENVSPAGARIIIGTRWPPQDSAVVLCSAGCVANAEVVYSHALSHDANQFAIGLRLHGVPRGWPVQESAMP